VLKVSVSVVPSTLENPVAALPLSVSSTNVLEKELILNFKSSLDKTQLYAIRLAKRLLMATMAPLTALILLFSALALVRDIVLEIAWEEELVARTSNVYATKDSKELIVVSRHNE